ncbi:hypothetical protein TRAPUB_7274 [Trametes pubescens]|uniref:Uncharacterized protein n=1 Tax=Trametes pubescens TaxID=154538 RepID=A0A1M2V3H2_TRAPU|nr:hypothetical protein TRAPUB_7274 [Trametes pubescens]
MSSKTEALSDKEAATVTTFVDTIPSTPEAMSDAKDRSAPSSQASLDVTAYPDGGLKAWLTVFGTVLALFCCGQLTAFGAFQTWYAQNQLRDLPASTISWIGSLQLWILYFSVSTHAPDHAAADRPHRAAKGGFLGRIFDAFGPRVILIPGSILLVVATMLTSVCTEYYQFLLVQGFMTGLSYGML